VAYQTGSATDVGDLIDELFTFATGLTTTPWTEDELDTLQGTLHLGDCYVTFRWDNSVATNGLAIYQSLGWTSSTNAWQMTDDSGNGPTGAVDSIGNRHVNFTDGTGADNGGPYTSYHFFAGEGSNPYIYVVVEQVSGVYRHFGFGNLEKINDFDGGEFVYGHHWYNNAAYIDNPTQAFHTFMLDGIDGVYPNQAATLHIENFPGQATGGKWGVFSSAANPGNDRGGTARLPLFGTTRSGGYGYHLTWMRASSLGAYKIISPITALYRDATTNPDTWRWLGQMPGIGLINMNNFDDGDEFTVGSDTYMVFPWVRKQYLTSDTEESWNAGVAYLKET
jgi:hypothetical protein